MKTNKNTISINGNTVFLTHKVGTELGYRDTSSLIRWTNRNLIPTEDYITLNGGSIELRNLAIEYPNDINPHTSKLMLLTRAGYAKAVDSKTVRGWSRPDIANISKGREVYESLVEDLKPPKQKETKTKVEQPVNQNEDIEASTREFNGDRREEILDFLVSVKQRKLISAQAINVIINKIIWEDF
jgi:hypothetical protein